MSNQDGQFKGLYKKPDSPYWWMSYTIEGKRFRVSTKCKDFESAKRFLERQLMEIRMVQFEKDWARTVDTAANNPASWLGGMLNSARSRAKRTNRSFDLTLGKLRELALRSNGRCMVTGIRFTPPRGKRDPFAPSLDRIDSSLGYEYDNCRMVCVAVNLAMSNWGEDVLMLIAKGIFLKTLHRELGYDEIELDLFKAGHDSVTKIKAAE